MAYISNIIFALVLAIAIFFFRRNILFIKRNIQLGQDIDRSDRSSERWSNMLRIALGQSKMVNRPIAGILHIIVYIGFIVINIELVEIVLDGLLGTHRLFAPYMGGVYNFLIASFEILAALVLVSVILFWLRRNTLKIKRFWKSEMKGWPKNDADYILYFEIVLMTLFLSMNATDQLLQELGDPHYTQAGLFPVSQFMTPPLFFFFTNNIGHARKKFLVVAHQWNSHFPQLSILFQTFAYSFGISQYLFSEPKPQRGF